jgi:large subunit ribosomal protein L23
MSILKRPLLTEKTTLLNEKGVYGFIVENTANKIEIRKAVEKMYGVTVDSVRTMRYAGKVKSRQSKTKMVSGRRPSFKKAIVTLSEGDFIDFYN